MYSLTANTLTAITAHTLLRHDAYSKEFRQRYRDSACADSVIPVGRYKALVQRKRMMKVAFVCKAEVEITAVQRARVRM